MKNLIAVMTLGLFTGVGLWAQVGIGQWETHLTYSNGKCVAVAGNKVYCGTAESLFSYNYVSQEIIKYDKPKGYVGLGVTAIGYSTTEDAVVVAYDDANVDIIKPGEIVNLPSIKEFLITGDKNIYNITMIGDSAILSCGFGVVIIDTDLEIIKTDVKFSDDLSFAGAICYDAAFMNGFYYFATSQGVYKVDYNTNIKNLSNWQLLTGLPSGHFNSIVNHNNTLYFNYSNYYTNALDNLDSLFSSDGTTSTYFNEITGVRIEDIETNYGYLGFLSPDMAWTGQPGSLSPISGCFTLAERLDLDASGGAWVAHDGAGLASFQSGCVGYYVDGPFGRNVWDIDVVNGQLWVAAGGIGITHANAFIADKMYYRQDGDWKWLNLPDMGYHYPPVDIHVVAADPNLPGHAFGGSWGTGIYELTDYNQSVTHYDNADGLDTTADPGLPIRIGGFSWDDNGNLWFSNSHTLNLLKYIDPAGVVNDYPPLFSSGNESKKATVVEVDTRGQIWVAIPGTGIVVANDNPIGQTRTLTNAFNSGDLPDLNIRALACDEDGQVWVGTHDGIRVFSASQVFNSTNINGQKIVIKDENGINELLLKETIINDIVVDGANRKWIATQGTGVRLVSSDGREIIHSFTAENSPLLSDIVRCISIDGESGDVYFGTDRGIVSFRSDATDGTDSFGDVYAFPNPVHPDYNGPIAIKGMAKDATVKITDIAGNIVFETRSEGGQAVWDGRRYDGKRPATGVYLVFCSNEDASETVVTKILYIN